jgi:hypothetical protein
MGDSMEVLKDVSDMTWGEWYEVVGVALVFREE